MTTIRLYDVSSAPASIRRDSTTTRQVGVVTPAVPQSTLIN